MAMPMPDHDSAREASHKNVVAGQAWVFTQHRPGPHHRREHVLFGAAYQQLCQVSAYDTPGVDIQGLYCGRKSEFRRRGWQAAADKDAAAVVGTRWCHRFHR